MKLLRWLTLCFLSLTLTLWLGSCSSPPQIQAVTLNLAASGMVRTAVEEIDRLYQQEHPNIWLNPTFAGTSVIRAAIEQGEPFDGVLLSEISALDALQAQGLILPESRRELVTTDIVVIAAADSAAVQLNDLHELASHRLKTVAIGNKDLAVGRYTHPILSRLGILQAVESKAVWAKVDVRQILRAVEQGEAEVGITFLPEAKAFSKVKVLATVSPDLYEPIRSGAAVVKTSPHLQEMQAYLDFVSSDRAMAVFQKFGLRPLRS
ncbi:molybdate ABC transporter substrate-binding protein [Microcoleus sp. Pol14C6]|uniref:molybdate ABC transporter substrate-binding protein n=1 Tax=unclassified Microcoleus TaxID=2642155 RepID=UPI002FD5E205